MVLLLYAIKIIFYIFTNSFSISNYASLLFESVPNVLIFIEIYIIIVVNNPRLSVTTLIINSTFDLLTITPDIHIIFMPKHIDFFHLVNVCVYKSTSIRCDIIIVIYLRTKTLRNKTSN